MSQPALAGLFQGVKVSPKPTLFAEGEVPCRIRVPVQYGGLSQFTRQVSLVGKVEKDGEMLFLYRVAKDEPNAGRYVLLTVHPPTSYKVKQGRTYRGKFDEPRGDLTIYCPSSKKAALSWLGIKGA